jgi:hypothetical protein
MLVQRGQQCQEKKLPGGRKHLPWDISKIPHPNLVSLATPGGGAVPKFVNSRHRFSILIFNLGRNLMMIEKRVLVPDRVRRPPSEGFSWLDRRFLRECAARLTGDAIFLYFFLAAVSDKQGLSFYSDSTLAVRLRMREEDVVAARDDLLTPDLIAFRPPLTQVLSLPRARLQRRRLHGLETLLRVVEDSHREGGAA